MSLRSETILIEQLCSSTSASTKLRSCLKSSRRRNESGSDENGSRPKKRLRIITPEKSIDSITDLDASADPNLQDQTHLLHKIRCELEEQFAPLLPSYDEFMTAFDIGYEKKDLCLAIKLTFLKVMNLEGHWRTHKDAHSIGFFKFSGLKALWRTLLKSTGDPRDVKNLHNILENCLKLLVKSEKTRQSLRQEHRLSNALQIHSLHLQ